jgi:hypothetical protein
VSGSIHTHPQTILFADTTNTNKITATPSCVNAHGFSFSISNLAQNQPASYGAYINDDKSTVAPMQMINTVNGQIFTTGIPMTSAKLFPLPGGGPSDRRRVPGSAAE